MIPCSYEAIRKADDMIDGLGDNHLRKLVRDGKTRRDFGVIAANIAEDRHGAGSSAALVAIYVLLTYGVQAAEDFVADMWHHEG